MRESKVRRCLVVRKRQGWIETDSSAGFVDMQRRCGMMMSGTDMRLIRIANDALHISYLCIRIRFRFVMPGVFGDC